MQHTAWSSMRSAMRASEEQRPVTRVTLRRVAAFAAPHRRKLVLFLLLSVVTAVLAVATPLLAGRVVNAIVDGASERTVIVLAAIIGAIIYLIYTRQR
jgi:ABC-type bacteriocin/lantibiotic exporter with double-glycine peptidase domain